MKGWKRFTRQQAGLSLIEATIILLVLGIMTAVLAPTAVGYLDDARRMKAKEDCEAIGLSIVRLLTDTGAPFLLRDGDLPLYLRHLESNRVDLLVSTGDTPGVHTGTVAGPTPLFQDNIASLVSWLDPLSDPEVDSMNDHLISNEVGYIQATTPFDTNDPFPPYSRGLFGRGWRGAYVSPIIGPDPWGYRYMVNSVYLGTALDSISPTQGQHGRGWAFDTICVSAGADNVVATNFEDTLGLSGNGYHRNGGTSWDEASWGSGFGANRGTAGAGVFTSGTGTSTGRVIDRRGRILRPDGSFDARTSTDPNDGFVGAGGGGFGNTAAGDDVVFVLSGFSL